MTKRSPFIKGNDRRDISTGAAGKENGERQGKIFGPYTSSQAVRDTIDLIHKLYHVRSCNRNLPRDTGKERPCLNYHIHQCDAPCQGYISKEEYRKSIDEVIRFLNGNFDGILKDLEEKMQAASEEQHAEQTEDDGQAAEETPTEETTPDLSLTPAPASTPES